MAASLKYRENPKWEVDKVRMIAAQCNKQKYNSKKASELSTELYTLKYIEMNSPLKTEAAVVEVREKYIDVIVIAMGLNRRIYFNNVSHHFFDYLYIIVFYTYFYTLKKNNHIFIFFQDFPGKYLCIKNKGGTKLSKMELTWNAVNQLPEITQVIQVFSILMVELYKDEDLGKIDIKLVRPQ